MHNYFDIPAVSNSFIGQVRAEALGQPPLNQRSPALRFGKSVHELFLEPEKFDFRTYTGPERMEIMKMKASFMEVAGHLLGGEKEVEYFYDYMGWRCKMKADIVDRDGGVITDLKTTAKTNLQDFQASALQYSYNRQAPWYMDAPPVKLLGINKFRIIAICKLKPYQVFVWEMDINDPLIEAGREEYKETLEFMSTNSKFNHLKINSNVKAITY